MTRAKAFHVLVATDGSPSAREAMTTTIRFPWPPDSRASAVVVKQLPAGVRHSILLAALDHTSESIARRAKQRLSRRWPAAGAIVANGDPAEAILKEARESRADVVVLGWRGHGPIRRLLTGSVSRGVVRRSACSVLVVRRAAREPRHVILALDGSQNAERALKFVSELDLLPGTHISVFRAVETMRAPTGGLVPASVRAEVVASVKHTNAQRRTAALRDLGHASKVLSARGWSVQQVITEGAPLRDLLAAVDRVGADLLVVGARGTTGLQYLLLGSVAEGALNQCPVPVLVVR